MEEENERGGVLAGDIGRWEAGTGPQVAGACSAASARCGDMEHPGQGRKGADVWGSSIVRRDAV
jgi:hypothetical protein